MNLTLSVDEKVVERARGAARAMNKSLNQLVREYLEQLAGETNTEGTLTELRQLSAQSDGHSHGEPLDRDELHERA